MTETHPLAAAFTQLAALNKRYPKLTLAEPDGQHGWMPAAELPAALSHLLAQYEFAHPAIETIAPPSRWFAGYINDLMVTVFGCYLLVNQVPDLRPEQVYVRFDDKGELSGLAWPGRQTAGMVTDCRMNPPRLFPARTLYATTCALP